LGQTERAWLERRSNTPGSTKPRALIKTPSTTNRYTHTLFFLAQCYGNLGEGEKSAYHCHLTLRRQFKDGKPVKPLAFFSKYSLASTCAHVQTCAFGLALKNTNLRQL
jgi:hypothetical protein